ncbi:MAG TPA: Asp23/Gls24 family envelope stress response protein [Fusibacter sp.]|nr:Asp23/Gls24 family envelope stress response protein [Fusibacter sp.]
MAENMTINASNHGKVNIADDVIGVIGSIAAAEIEGVKSLSGTFSEEIMSVMGKKSFNKGVRVEMENDVILIELSVIVDYGTKIHEIAKQVQENVKIAIESMTGFKVSAVNVFVEGINTKVDGK